MTARVWNLGVAAILATCISAIGGTPPPDTNLAGTWSGAAGGVSVSLQLTWTADSVTGTGGYSVGPVNTLGCGGENLTGTGQVTLSAARSGVALHGHMVFSDTLWTPPYSGTLQSNDRITGSFMSVDRGSCELDLVRRG